MTPLDTQDRPAQQTPPAPGPAESSTEFFGWQAERWMQLYESKPQFRDRLRVFTRALREALPSGGRVLDFGCGPGAMALVFAEMGYQVTALDGSARMIEVARREQQRRGIENVWFDVMDAGSLALPSRHFDAVVCSSVLEYIEDDVALTRRLHEALRPGGWFLVSVPHTASVPGWIEDRTRSLRTLSSRVGRRHLGYSLRRYSRRGFTEMLRQVGFDEFRVRYFELPLPGFAAATLSRLAVVGVMMLVVCRRLEPERHAPGAVGPRRRARSRKNVWEATPPALRRLIGRPLSLLGPTPLLGRRFRRVRRFVESSQWWDAERIRAYQTQQLRRICTLAYEQSPFYRAWFEKAGFDPRDLRQPEDLRAVPPIDRETVRAHLAAMCTVDPATSNVDFVSTGGTGGQPLHFYIGAERSSIEYAYLVASWERAGFALGATMAVLRGRVVPPGRDGLRCEYDPLLRHWYYSTFHMDDEDMRRYLEHIRRIGPCFLHVYPSTVAILARFIRRSGLPAPPNIRGVIAESEVVYPEQRRLVEDVFAVRYFSCYGHTEKLVSAAECEHSSDYHVWPTYGYFELLDAAGRPVTTPGQRGEIVGTGFINTVMPFIRYRTGDYATYVAERCEACGRNHVLIRDICGHRTQELLVAHDGSLVPWTALNMHDDTFLNVLRFQFYQDRPGFAVLRIVPGESFGPADQQRIAARLARKLAGRIELDVQAVPEIETTPRGKATYVIQKLPVPEDDDA